MNKILLILAFIGIGYFCERATEGFTILRIASDRPYNPDWKTNEPATVQQALNQKFRYFGCGGQVFVFFSEDEKYVLKFFKQKSYNSPLWIHCLPDFLPYKKKKIAAKEARFHRDFKSYKLASDQIREHTGTLYAHLNKTGHLKTQFVLIDKLGIEHALNADEFDFVLQERAEMVEPRLEHLMKNHDVEGAKKAISSLLEMITDRTRKGVIDRYPNLFKNFGFIGNRAVELDIGRFMPGHKQEGLPRLRLEFGRWLKSRYPELAEHWEEEFSRFQRSILFETCST